MSAFDRFSPAAQQVMQLAHAEARRLDHDSIGTEHLLLGILHIRDDVACLILNGLEVTHIAAIVALTKISYRDEAVTGELPLTRYVQQALVFSREEAQRSGAQEVLPLHLLLAIFRIPNSSAQKVLGQMGLNVNEIRTRVYQLLEPRDAPKSVPDSLQYISRELRAARQQERERDPLAGWEHEFNPGVRSLVLAARGKAFDLGNAGAGTQHILLVILENRSLASSRVLQQMGVRPDDVQFMVRAMGESSGTRGSSGLTDPVKTAIREAEMEARELRSRSADKEHLRFSIRRLKGSEVGPDHVLLAMLALDRGMGSLILRGLGLDLDVIRRKIEIEVNRSATANKSRSEPPASLWELFNQQMIRNRLDVAALAARIGTSQRRVRLWFSGQRSPNLRSCDAIAAALRIEPNLVRRLAGRPERKPPLEPNAEAGQGEPINPLAIMRDLFGTVDWTDERISRMTALLQTMIDNDADRAQPGQDEQEPRR